MKKQLLSIFILQLIAINVFAQVTLTLQPDAAAGKDAEIFSCAPCGYPDRNFGTKQDLDAVAWTNNGNFGIIRSLIQFDLSSIPVGSTILTAKLSLYYNLTSEEGTDVSSLIHPNGCVLRRITQDWSESTVTWNNRPLTTKTNKVKLAHSTSSTQDYPNINVKLLVQDMVNNPTKSFGFMLKLRKEVKFNKLLFASSDNANPALRPKLVVTYTVPANLPEENKAGNLNSSNLSQAIGVDMELIPNPTKDQVALNLSAKENDEAQLSVFNIIGKEVLHQTVSLTEGNNQINFQTATWGKGIYLFLVKTSESIITKKLIVE